MLRGFGLDSLLGQKTHNTTPNCQCGCVPNVMSLHDAARERARRREAEAQRKQTLAEYIAQNPTVATASALVAAPATPGDAGPPNMLALAGMMASECDPE